MSQQEQTGRREDIGSKRPNRKSMEPRKPERSGKPTDPKGSVGSTDGEDTSPAGFGGKTTLISRIITGAVLIVTVAACLFAGSISSMVLIAVLNAFCCYEFCRMMHIDGREPNDIAGIIVAAAIPVCYRFGGFLYALTLTAVLMIVLLIWYVFSPRTRITDLALTLFGTVYCGIMLSSLLIIRLARPGLEGGILVFGVVLSVWVNDTFAYFIGSRFGRHRLAPKISPKKSWEGFWGGLVGSVLVWCLLPFFVEGISYPLAVSAGIVCGVGGVIGDIVESRIKRGAGVKDSGNLLPGHGGFLDRCDSLIFVSVIALLMLAIGRVI